MLYACLILFSTRTAHPSKARECALQLVRWFISGRTVSDLRLEFLNGEGPFVFKIALHPIDMGTEHYVIARILGPAVFDDDEPERDTQFHGMSAPKSGATCWISKAAVFSVSSIASSSTIKAPSTWLGAPRHLNVNR